MLVLLCQRGCIKTGQALAAELQRAFAAAVDVRAVSAITAKELAKDPSWADLLVVVYRDGARFEAAGSDFIRSYIARRGRAAAVLPVCVGTNSNKPPAGADAIKSFELNSASPSSFDRLVSRIGGMLGLKWQGRDSKIFISYRLQDGEAIAKQLHRHFASLGHPTFLDQAKEIDGETMILPGREIEAEIGRALESADMVILVDTPLAPASPWIQHEIKVAGSLLLPILPISFRESGDHRRGPRFRSLLALQRWVELPFHANMSEPLSEDQLNEIALEAERYLCEVFCRKCRVPFLVEKEFVSRGFVWKVLNGRLLMFQSTKGLSRLITKVISHCSIFDPHYGPALERFMIFLKENMRGNFSLFIYDGELLAEGQLAAIAAMHEEQIVILHHQELATLIDSNFTTLSLS